MAAAAPESTACPATSIEGYDGIDFATHIVLQATKDGETVNYKISRAAAGTSAMVKAMMDGQDEGEVIVELDEVDGRTLGYVVAYLEHHADQTITPIEKPLKGPIQEVVSEWVKAFLFTDLVVNGKEDEHELLLQVLMAAHFMNIEPLRDLCCCCIASMVMGKKTEEIRKTFHIVNDFTPEQQARIDEEMKYAVDE